MTCSFCTDTATGNYSVHRTDLGIRNTKRHVELGRRTGTGRDATVDQPAAHIKHSRKKGIIYERSLYAIQNTPHAPK